MGHVLRGEENACTHAKVKRKKQKIRKVSTMSIHCCVYVGESVIAYYMVFIFETVKIVLQCWKKKKAEKKEAATRQ